MAPKIQKAAPAQFEECAKVIREAFQTVADDFGFTPENNPTNGAFLQPDKLTEDYNKGIVMFGLYTEGKQAGFVAIEKKEDSLYYLEKLAVLPRYRHHGYGRLLMDYVRDYVKTAGGGRISIAIINENTVLKDWYLAYGFRETGLKTFEHLTFTVCFMEIVV